MLLLDDYDHMRLFQGRLFHLKGHPTFVAPHWLPLQWFGEARLRWVLLTLDLKEYWVAHSRAMVDFARQDLFAVVDEIYEEER